MLKQSLCTSKGEVIENEHYLWIFNMYPKFDGHTMIVPKRHLLNFEEETEEETVSRHKLLIIASETLRKVFPNTGIEIFLQTGTNSGRSIRHIHWHIVPANLSDPLRSFEKLGHFYTTEPNKEKVVLFPIPIKLACEELKKAVAKVL